jgi:hypothetical protein
VRQFLPYTARTQFDGDQGLSSQSWGKPFYQQDFDPQGDFILLYNLWHLLQRLISYLQIVSSLG